MRRISVDVLTPTQTLARPLYHESGALLFAAGDRLGEEEIGLLKLHGVKKVYELGADEPGSTSMADGDVEARIGAPVPASVREADLPDEVRQFLRDRGSQAACRAFEKVVRFRVAEERLLKDPRAELRPENYDRIIAASRAGETAQGVSLRERLAGLPRPRRPRLPREKAACLEMRRLLLDDLAAILSDLGDGRADPGMPERLVDLARAVLLAMSRDLELCLALPSSPPPSISSVGAGAELRGGDGLLVAAAHAFNVAVLSAAAGIELDYGPDQLLELTIAALMHDIGMRKLPTELAAKPSALSEGERKELERHPFLGLELLRRLPEVPLALVPVVLEEHERPDGSGYPRRLGSDLSEFARIVAVADVYDALTTVRPYRAAPLPPHVALRELVACAARRKLDARVLRALMKALSLFPVGSYVRLSDGSIGRVVASGAPDLSRPWVAQLGGPPGSVPGAEPTSYLDLGTRPDLKVVDTPLAVEPGAPRDDPLSGF